MTSKAYRVQMIMPVVRWQPCWQLISSPSTNGAAPCALPSGRVRKKACWVAHAYAQRAYNTGENILGYLNLDMIAWNTVGSDPYITLAYATGMPPTQQLAQLFTDVIATYNINLLASYAPDMWGSDHNSFWDYGFTSILAIEDDVHGDFNPYYHTSQDTPAHTDPVYFTNFVKASIATYAHMTGCLIPPGDGCTEWACNRSHRWGTP